MTSRHEVHRLFDEYAKGAVQSGTLPAGFHVLGAVAWSE
jgi:hypothetical protein